MPASIKFSFKKEIALIETPNQAPVLQVTGNTLSLDHLPAGLLAAFRILDNEGATRPQLTELVAQSEGAAGVADFDAYLDRFIKLGFICQTVDTDSGPLATLVPFGPSASISTDKVNKNNLYILSRFAYCHQVDGQMVLESPLTTAQIILHDWRSLALIGGLTRPNTYIDLCREVAGISPEAAKLFFVLLLNMNAIAIVEDSTSRAEENRALAPWEFHDLLFHARSRLGRHGYPYGAVYPLKGIIEPPPVTKPPMSDQVIDLYKPDLDQLKETDLPFTFVLEQRRSIRQYGERPITQTQLGEFLYRVGRVKTTINKNSEDLTLRPYPSGGARHSLELYLVVNTCLNIPKGIYHYAPELHQLGRLPANNDYFDQLLRWGRFALEDQDTPQVLIAITARFARVYWKYKSMAYALILKDVGVLYQTMYLVATAMDLAPCAIGGGNSDLFAKAIGTDYYEETSVGEFALGSKPKLEVNRNES
ncbi:MAG: SagB family peptide dehydrogenase [Anaerolineae bacterium]|nr:SagB family peptide dehydrogenase [Anaerolineae bacterium]